MEPIPVACTLDAAGLQARKEGLLAELLVLVESRAELPDGHRFRFAATGEVLALIVRAIDAERRCCRFLRFRLTVEPAGGPVELEITGPPGTREFVAGLLPR